MTKEFKDWLDEFVEQGVNPKDVTNWPEEADGTVELQDKTANPTTIKQEITADEGYDGLGKVTIDAIELQNKTVSPTTVSQEVEADADYDGLGTVTIEGVELQDKTVTPTTAQQIIEANENYDGLSKVTVNAVTNDIDENIVAENIKKDVNILGVTGTYEGEAVELQDKTVSPSTTRQEIVADENYDGLSKVTIEAIELQNKEISPSTGSQSVIPDKGYDGLREVTVNAIALQDKTVTPDAVRQEITYDSNYNGLGKVTVEAVEPVELQDKTVTPTTEIQRVTADVDYSGLGTVTINAVTNAIDKNIKAENIKKDVSILGVTGNWEFETQDKTVSPSTIKQEIVADENYDGLGKVTINAVTNDIDENIVAENIKKDVNILGVTGTYEGETVELQDKTVSPTTESQNVTADEDYDGLGTVIVNAVTSAIDQNIIAENIKKDVSILGVTGTYEENCETQEKTISPSTNTQEITPDEGYDGLSKVTVNAVTSAIDENIVSGNIKKDVSILGVTGTYEGIVGAAYNITKLDEFFPEKLSGVGVAQLGSNVYLFGGNGENGVVTSIYKFDTDTETISTLSITLPQGLSSMGVAQIGSNVYLFGGLFGAHIDYKSVNTIYKFNVETETISTLSTTLPQALEGMGVATVGSNVYLFGGYREGDSVNTIYKFDTDTETISALTATLPQVLSRMGIAQIGSNVYLFGGYDSINYTFYKFDTDTETITTLHINALKGLNNMGIAQIGSNVYLFGGSNYYNYKKVNTIYKFNVETETISTLSTTLPQALEGMGVATVGSNVYLFGGASASTKLDTIYKFNVDF